MKGSQPLNKMVNLVLSAEMNESVREVAGSNFSAWVREAIAEKLAKLEKEKLVV